MRSSRLGGLLLQSLLHGKLVKHNSSKNRETTIITEMKPRLGTLSRPDPQDFNIASESIVVIFQYRPYTVAAGWAWHFPTCNNRTRFYLQVPINKYLSACFFNKC